MRPPRPSTQKGLRPDSTAAGMVLRAERPGLHDRDIRIVREAMRTKTDSDSRWDFAQGAVSDSVWG